MSKRSLYNVFSVSCLCGRSSYKGGILKNLSDKGSFSSRRLKMDFQKKKTFHHKTYRDKQGSSESLVLSSADSVSCDSEEMTQSLSADWSQWPPSWGGEEEKVLQLLCNCRLNLWQSQLRGFLLSLRGRRNKQSLFKLEVSDGASVPEEWIALLLFCITSIRAPTMPDDGAWVGGAESVLSSLCQNTTGQQEQLEQHHQRGLGQRVITGLMGERVRERDRVSKIVHEWVSRWVSTWVRGWGTERGSKWDSVWVSERVRES